MAQTEVTAIYRADTAAYVRGVKAAQASTKAFADATAGANRSAGSMKASTVALGSAMGILGTQAIGMATAKLKQFTTQAITSAASYEQTVISIEGIFVGMGKSVEQATAETKTYLADLRDFAATTPFELPQTLDAVKRLLSIGYAAEDVKDRLLPAIGDITSALGQPASAINGVVYAMGQIKSAGRVMQQDLMQIGNALPGFNARMAIAKELFNGDMNAMAQAVESGALTGEKAIEALISQMQKFPGAAGAMERQSKTLNGVISTFKDTVNNAMIDALMPAMPVLSESLMGLVDPVSQLAVAFASQLGPTLVQVATSAQEFAPQFSEMAAAFMELAGGALVRLVEVMGALAPVFTIAAKTLSGLAMVLQALPDSVLAAVAALLILMRTGIGKAFITSVGSATIGVAKFGATTLTSSRTAATGFAAIGTSAVASMRVTDAAMKAGTAAVNGFKIALSSTGIGLLIVGISTALTAMAFSSDEASQSAQNLTDSILDQNGALVENHRQLIAKSLAEQGILDAATKAGIATNELVDAYLAGGNALQPYIDKMYAYADANRDAEEGIKLLPDWLWDSSSAMGEQAGAVQDAANALGTYSGTLDAARATNQQAVIAAEGVTAAYANTAVETGKVSMATLRAAEAAELYNPAAQTAATATGALADEAAEAAAAIEAMRNQQEQWLKVTGQISAVDAAAAALEQIGTSAVENTNKLIGTSPKIRAFRGDVISAFEQAAASATSLGKNAEEQRQIFTGELVKIVAALRASKVKDSDIQTFLMAMDDLPASVEQIMTAAGVAVGKGAKRFKTDVQKQIEDAFSGGAKAARPLNEQAMDAMAEAATAKAKSQLGLTLEPQLASVLKSTASALSSTALAEGESPGLNLSAGIAAGVDKGSPLVVLAVRRVIAAAKAAADAASESQSPSKLFAEVGDNLIQGLRLGWDRGSKDFVDGIARTMQDAFWSLKDAGDAVADAKKRLKEVREERKKGDASAREVAAAERDLARAYRDQVDAQKAAADAQRNLNAARRMATFKPPQVNWTSLLDEFNKSGDLSRVWDALSDKLYDRAMRAGMTPEAAQAYVDGVIGNIEEKLARRLRRLDALSRELSDIRERLSVLTEIATERESGRKSISDFLADRFGEPSEFDKAYRSAELSVDQAIALFDRAKEMIEQRLGGGEGIGDADKAQREGLVKYVEVQTQALVALIKKRNDLLEKITAESAKLKDLEDKRNQAQEKFTQSILDFSKISGKIGSAQEYIMGLEQRAAATKKYVEDIAALRKKGVAESVIQQILAAGPEQGGSFAAALASASAEQVQYINTLTAQNEATATAFGDAQAGIMYDAGITAQRSLVTGLQTEYNTVITEMNTIVAGIEAALAPLGTAGYTAGDQLLAQTIAGLKAREKEILDEIARIGAAIQAAWTAAMTPVTPSPGSGGGGGGGGGGRGRTTTRAATVPAPVIPYTTAPAISVASGGVQVAVTVGADQNPAAASEAVKSAVMEALSEVAARAANARR